MHKTQYCCALNFYKSLLYCNLSYYVTHSYSVLIKKFRMNNKKTHISCEEKKQNCPLDCTNSFTTQWRGSVFRFGHVAKLVTPANCKGVACSQRDAHVWEEATNKCHNNLFFYSFIFIFFLFLHRVVFAWCSVQARAWALVPLGQLEECDTLPSVYSVVPPCTPS